MRKRIRDANLNVKLKQRDLDFLRDYAASVDRTITSLIDDYINQLRQQRYQAMEDTISILADNQINSH